MAAERPRMEATYPSRCPHCDGQIEAGDPIALDEPDGEWCHEDCADEVAWDGLPDVDGP